MGVEIRPSGDIRACEMRQMTQALCSVLDAGAYRNAGGLSLEPREDEHGSGDSVAGVRVCSTGRLS